MSSSVHTCSSLMDVSKCYGTSASPSVTFLRERLRGVNERVHIYLATTVTPYCNHAIQCLF